MDAAHRVSCRQRVSRAPHPSVVTPKPPRLPVTSSLPAVDSCPTAGGTPCSRRMRSRSTRSAARSSRPPTPEASVPVHPAASLHSRPGAAGGSLGSATRARARRVGRGVPGTRARPPGTTSLGGGGAPRLARGAGSAAQLSPLVAACPPPRLSQPTTSMRAPDPPDRHGRSPCSSTRCPDNAVCAFVFDEPVGSGPREIGARRLAFCLAIAGAALIPTQHAEQREPDESTPPTITTSPWVSSWSMRAASTRRRHALAGCRPGRD
jgi:hypothetical protein